MEEYEITLNDEQLFIIANCLETAVDIKLGKMPDRSYPYNDMILRSSISTEDRDKLMEHFKGIKSILFPDLHEHENMGVGKDPETDHIYEMYKDIMHSRQKVLEKEGARSTWNVHSNKPMKFTNKPNMVVKHLSKDILRDRTIDSILSDEEEEEE